MGASVLGPLLFSVSCLEPFDEGEIALERAFGPADIEPDDAPRAEGTAGLDLSRFSRSARRLVGFAGGSTVAFWRVDGEVTNLIAPAFRLERDGRLFGKPIVDALPGANGYSPLWRLLRVPVTSAYREERIWSRAAVEAGVELGILEPPIETEIVLVAPIFAAPTSVETKDETSETTDVWYRNQLVAWFRFPSSAQVEPSRRRLEAVDSYTFARVNQVFVLDEDREGIDLDGDGATRNAHVVLPTGVNPVCNMQLARASAEFRSIDSTALPDVRSLEDPALTSVGQPPILFIQELDGLSLCPKDAP